MLNAMLQRAGKTTSAATAMARAMLADMPAWRVDTKTRKDRRTKIKEKERVMFDHIQLKVKDLKASKRFYTAALAPLGFTVQYEGDGLIGFGLKDAPALWLDNGEPGLRPAYHANYYGGFVKDLDGNNVEAVCHQEE